MDSAVQALFFATYYDPRIINAIEVKEKAETCPEVKELISLIDASAPEISISENQYLDLNNGRAADFDFTELA
jgi:hypothetical protein